MITGKTLNAIRMKFCVPKEAFRPFWIRCGALLFLGVIGSGSLKGQTPVITVLQNINFGPFAVTGQSGGTVTVPNNGARSSTGDIFLVEGQYNYTIFNVEASAGTYLDISIASPVTLTGSNGGQMTMEPGQADPPFPYTTSATVTEFHLGGTLTVGTDSPSGSYSGTYDIIINYQ